MFGAGVQCTQILGTCCRVNVGIVARESMLSIIVFTVALGGVAAVGARGANTVAGIQWIERTLALHALTWCVRSAATLQLGARRTAC